MSDTENFGAAETSSDTFRETTSTSWLSRIGEAIKGVLFGLVLVIGGCVGIFWNEGRAVQTERSLHEGQSLVVDVDATKIDSAVDGKLVHVTGELKTGAKLGDPEFFVTAEGVRLVRTVEMYQWREESRKETRKNLGGSEETVTTYSYVREWSDRQIDSAKFRQAGGHGNPQMRYGRFEVAAQDATLGAYRPGERVLALLPADRALRLDAAAADAVRAKLGAVQAIDGKLFVGTDPAQPRIGDLRISWHIAPAGTVSLVARQAGTDLDAYQTKAGDRLLMVRTGVVSAADMFKAAESGNRVLTWIIRAVAAICIFIGFCLVFRPLAVVADVVPLVGDMLGAGIGVVALVLTATVAPVVIALAWLWYRPLVSIAVLAAGGAIAFAVRYLASRKTVRTPPAAAPA